MNWLLYASPIFLGKISGQLTTHKNGKGLGERDIGNFLRSSIAFALVITPIAFFAYPLNEALWGHCCVPARARCVSRAYLLAAHVRPRTNAYDVLIDQLCEPSTECGLGYTEFSDQILLSAAALFSDRCQD